MNPNDDIDEPQNDDEPQTLRIGVHMNPNDEPQNDLMNPKFSGSNYYTNVRYNQSLNHLYGDRAQILLNGRKRLGWAQL